MEAVTHASEPHAANLSSDTARRPQARPATVSSALIWAGVVLFLLGLASIIVTFVVPLLDARVTPLFYYLAMLAPAGMILGVIGALASGRRVRTK